MSQYTRKGYFAQERDEVTGIAIVATSAKEAKKIAYYKLNCDWVDIRVSWRKEANVMDLPVGVIRDNNIALRRGVYSWIEEGECDICHEKGYVNYYPPKPSDDKNYAVRYKGRAICDKCEDKT